MRRAAVIGAGLIGSLLDRDRPAGAPALTHAGGYAASEAFTLAAIAEPDPGRRRAAAAAWGCPVFADAGTLLEAVRPEVVSL
jgi:predicted dehydrogenase